MIKYSKNRLLNNIDLLLKEKDMKISELEGSIKVSPGYFSRLRNNENDEACPSIDTLSSIAETLGTTLTSILYCDLSMVTETESFIIQSINSVIDKTNKDDIKWEKKTSQVFVRSTFPLCGEYKTILGLPEYHFVSAFTGESLSVTGDVLYFKYKNDSYYLIPLDDEGDKTQYEFYMLYANTLAKKVFNANSKSKDGFVLIMESLYDAASKSVKKIRIDENVKKGLEELIK